jgi:poly(3-hydroxybutyrate) depolymerase
MLNLSGLNGFEGWLKSNFQMRQIKIFLIGALLMVFAFSCDESDVEVINEDQKKEIKVGINRDTISVNNQDRNFKFYVPQNFSDDASLLFRFHGSYSVSTDPNKGLPDPVAGIKNDYVLNKIANTENIVVVYPVGSLINTSIGWNKTESELRFFDEMLEYFKSNFDEINFNRVYVCGHSSGAIFSFALAGYRAEKIAAAVPVSGQYRMVNGVNDSFVLDNLSIPLRAYNGTADPKVHYEAVYQNLSIWFEKENKGDSDNIEEATITLGSYDVEVIRWQGGQSDLELYSLKNVGHGISWNTIGESMWEFMKSHSKN